MHVIYDIYLMQSEYIHASHEWERERAFLNKRLRQMELELGAFRMDMAGEDSDGGDA